jgi:DNA-directed RNA polymerase subunit RPC12/RpoP
VIFYDNRHVSSAKREIYTLANQHIRGTLVRSLICPTCSAPISGPTIPAWIQSVTCNYCGGNIILQEFQESKEAMKQFEMDGFEDFLRQKGVSYDPVSRAVSVGSATFFIDSSGFVMPDRPEALRQVVLRWISEYLNQS